MAIFSLFPQSGALRQTHRTLLAGTGPQTLSDESPEVLLSGRRATEKGVFIFPIPGPALQAQKSESASRSSASIRLVREWMDPSPWRRP